MRRAQRALSEPFAVHREPLYRARVTENRLPDWPQDPAIFLDLDGTLIEFADAPDAVERPGRFKALLDRLAGLEHGAVAFVSGRTIRELDKLLAPHRFAAAGVHGAERRDVSGRLAPSPVEPASLDAVRERMRRLEAEYPGLLFEDKEISLALHYRRRPELADIVQTFAVELARVLPSEFAALSGKMVLEVKPAGIDKGSAIRAFMSEAPFAGRTPVFIGDDVTDEAGFGVVNALGGESVKVSAGDSAAKWFLRDVQAALTWLEHVVAA